MGLAGKGSRVSATVEPKQQPVDPAALVAPQAPHDALAFDELAARYNFKRTSDRRRVFARLVIGEIERRRAHSGGPVRALDIGCGQGIGRNLNYQRAIADAAGEFWGIEPDEDIRPQPGLYANFQHALLETARIPEASIDVAYSFMVMEHVADPAAFFRAVRRALKPGGCYLFLTVNGRHYFTILAKALHAMKMDEGVLKALKRAEAEKYHYPVVYKCNTEPDLRRWAREAGFEAPEFVYLESEGPGNYLPGPLKALAIAGDLKRRTLKNPRQLLNLVCRLRRPASGG
jgi:2-polyprenyl-3-methyl-5-hydroxy-6-metoxy-1,4-benzoquinol methylase